MSEIKNAVVVGKVNLPARRVVEVQKKAEPRREQPRPPRTDERKPKRADDGGFAARNANQQMLQELNWVKAQLRKAKDDYSAVATRAEFVRIAAKELISQLEANPAFAAVAPDAIQALKDALGK
jgi:hypothetical protein